MSSTVLVGLADRLEAIKREAKMRLAEEKRGDSKYADIWQARLPSIETCIEAMTEVDLDAELDKYLYEQTSEVLVRVGRNEDGTLHGNWLLDRDIPFSEWLLARIKEEK